MKTAYDHDHKAVSRILLFILSVVLSLIAATSNAQDVANPAFQEQDEFTKPPGYARDNSEITGWKYSGKVGINPGKDFNPFMDNGEHIVGNKVAFLHNNSSLRQVVRGFERGSQYTLSFIENARSAFWKPNTPPMLTVKVGGITVVAPHIVEPIGGEKPYTARISEPFTATDSSLELLFTNSVPEGEDLTVLIDNVSITKVDEPMIPEAFLGDELLLVYEGFDYPEGQNLLTVRADGIGWSGNYRFDDILKDFTPAVVASPGLKKSELACAGNRIIINQRGSLRALDMNKISLRFTSTGGETLRSHGESIWLSVLARHEDTAAKSGFYGVCLYHANANDKVLATNEVFFVGVGRDQTEWKIGGPGATIGQTGIKANELALLIVRIDWNDDGSNQKPDAAYLWVDPRLDQENPSRATADAICVRTGQFAFNWVGFRGKGRGSLDEFRIGTSFRSVAPSSTQ